MALDTRSLLVGALGGAIIAGALTVLVMRERHRNYVDAARNIRASESALRKLGTPEERIEEISREFWEE